jgi:hypothetical protein
VITVTLGWGTGFALLAWSALVFWLGRSSAGSERGDLSGPPPTILTATRPMAPGGIAQAHLSPERLASIRGEIARGNKIAAIKLMREATGLGLAEAKQAVEAMGG